MGGCRGAAAVPEDAPRGCARAGSGPSGIPPPPQPVCPDQTRRRAEAIGAAWSRADGVHQRVRHADPAIVVQARRGGRTGKWMRGEPAGYIQQHLWAADAHRSVRIPFSIVVSLALLGVVAEMA